MRYEHYCEGGYRVRVEGGYRVRVKDVVNEV